MAKKVKVSRRSVDDIPGVVMPGRMSRAELDATLGRRRSNAATKHDPRPARLRSRAAVRRSAIEDSGF